jgi:hypothetical protein
MSDDGALEKLSKKLDSGTSETHLKRAALYTAYEGAPQSWKPTVEPEDMKRKPKAKPLELLFAASAVFFVFAVVIAGLLFFGGNNTVSTKNVDVQISGPAQAGAGSTLSLQIVVTNKNAVPMELTDLIVEFPEGTRSDFDISVELPRIRESLGTIEPGESVNRTVRAVLFGLSGTNAEIKASAEFRVPSSNAVFVSESTYSVTLNESPASISVETLKETISGQEVTFAATIRSNAPDVLSDMMLLVTYPPGFTYVSSSPSPAVGTSVWEVGDIEPGGARTVQITGTFSGEDGESRVLKFVSGNKKEGQLDEIAAPLATSDVSITLRKPFISVEISLKGQRAAAHTVSRGEKVTGTVRWVNNLPNRAQNVSIRLTLNGQAIDQTTIDSQNGFYNSNISSIIWDASSDSAYADVGPGEFGSENFSFTVVPANKGNLRNSEITFSASVEANRISEANVPEAIGSSDSTKALVLTDFVLTAVSAPSSGPVPPKVGAETRYLVTWNASNSGNAVASASVSGQLPSYVSFVGDASAGEVSYNETARTVSWAAGDLAIGQSKNVSFIVSLLPSISQVGASPDLVINQRATGLDRFARKDVTSFAPNINTSGNQPSSSQSAVVP